jgi:hypothetical protein
MDVCFALTMVCEKHGHLDCRFSEASLSATSDWRTFVRH